MNNRGFLAGAVFGSALSAVVVTTLTLAACSGNKQQDAKTAKDAIILANDTCVVIHDVVPDGSPANDVCAKENELVPFINLILGSRKHAQVGGDAGAVAPDAAGSAAISTVSK